MANDNSVSRARYDFKKAMEEIKNYRGKGTELISVYIPYGKLISDVMAYLRDEQSQASNIKSKTTMNEDEMLKRLAADGMLVKRPLLVGDNFVLVGFKEAEWESRLKK